MTRHNYWYLHIQRQRQPQRLHFWSFQWKWRDSLFIKACYVTDVIRSATWPGIVNLECVPEPTLAPQEPDRPRVILSQATTATTSAATSSNYLLLFELKGIFNTSTSAHSQHESQTHNAGFKCRWAGIQYVTWTWWRRFVKNVWFLLLLLLLK